MQQAAIVGLGGIGRLHLSRYKQVPEVQVTAIGDLRTAEIRQDTSLKELFEVPWRRCAGTTVIPPCWRTKSQPLSTWGCLPTYTPRRPSPS
mgnify:CR=1 FL=1